MRYGVAVGVLVAFSAGAAPDAGSPHAHIWRIPQVRQVVDMPGRVQALNTPVQMHAVRSKASMDVIGQELSRQFLEAGLYFPPRGDLTPVSTSYQLTGLDPDTYIAYTVFLQPNPDQTTTVILTEAFLAEHTRGSAEVTFAPVMSDAKNVLVTRTEGAELAYYRSSSSPQAIQSFYATTLKQQGYAEQTSGHWLRNSDVLEISTKPVATGSQQVVVLHRRAAEGRDEPGKGRGR